MMKISIVTPTFNSMKYLEDTLESVLNQKFRGDIQYIVVDGGSTDGTFEILKAYEKKVRDGVYCREGELEFITIQEKDNGMYDALGKAFKKVDGDICAYINSDDFYMPNAFSLMLKVFSQYEDVNWISGINVTYNQWGNSVHHSLPFKYDSTLIIKGVYGKFLRFIQQESVFFRKELLIQVDIEKLRRFRYAGDYYLWKSLAKNNELRIIKAALSGFRVSGNQLSVSHLQEYYKEFDSIAEGKIGLTDYLKMIYYKFCWYCPDKIKQSLNKSIIDSSKLEDM